MKRSKKIYKVPEDLLKQIDEEDSEVEFFIDECNSKEIIAFLDDENNSNKFKMVLRYTINPPPFNDKFYGPEDKNNAKLKAMKFSFGSGRNFRIYCLDYRPALKKIVMVKLYNKKTDKIDKKLKNILDGIGDYEYDFSE